MAEAGRCVYNQVVAETLRKENHEAWFQWVKNYLIAKDLWEVIDGTFERPHEEDEDHKHDVVRWRRTNAAALHVIHISCSSEYFSHIKGVSEAKDAWHILYHTYNYNPPKSPLLQGHVELAMLTLYKAIRDDNWYAVKAFLDQHPNALSTKVNSAGQTALHVAILSRHVGIVEELVRLVPPENLEMVDVYGRTPLLTATFTGIIPMAACMVAKNRKTLSIPTPQMSLHVSLAFSVGHEEMGRYLYSVTPLEVLKPENGSLGLELLRCCLYSRHLDVVLDLLGRCEELLFALDNTGWGPIMGIASMPSIFPSGSKFMFWKRWIYNYIRLQSSSPINHVGVDIQPEGESDKIQGLKEIYEVKLLHAQAAQILSLLHKKLSFWCKSWNQDLLVADCLFRAAKEGIVEFVVEVLKAKPELLMVIYSSASHWHTFFYAVQYRQAEVSSLIHGLLFKDVAATYIDNSGNSMLHVAGRLAPSYQLNRIAGPALQMQRELQWFKEVESLVPPRIRVYQNNEGMQPEDIFRESHKELRKDGEKWMKETASSCSVVGALVVTIMFAVAFTVPGGNNQDSGYPVFSKEKLFTLFIISDALSLFSASTSVLMFLGILTSR